MKRISLIGVAVLAFLLLAAKYDESQPLGVNVTIAPASREEYQLLRDRIAPDTYVCRAQVYDAANESYVFATPSVAVKPGERQSDTVTVQGLQVKFTVAVSKENDRATSQVVAKRGEKVVLSQTSDVALHARGKTIVPLR